MYCGSGSLHILNKPSQWTKVDINTGRDSCPVVPILCMRKSQPKDMKGLAWGPSQLKGGPEPILLAHGSKYFHLSCSSCVIYSQKHSTECLGTHLSARFPRKGARITQCCSFSLREEQRQMRRPDLRGERKIRPPEILS